MDIYFSQAVQTLVECPSRDQKTAEYFSKLCSVTTVEKFSFLQRDHAGGALAMLNLLKTPLQSQIVQLSFF